MSELWPPISGVRPIQIKGVWEVWEGEQVMCMYGSGLNEGVSGGFFVFAAL